MRVPQGTRGAVCTSTRRLNEASPKLSMTVDEQLPPARTVAGSAGGQGFTLFSRPGGLTLRESDDRRASVHGIERCPRKSQHWGGSAFSGDFSVVLAERKKKNAAPQALADGRKGTGKG